MSHVTPEGSAATSHIEHGRRAARALREVRTRCAEWAGNGDGPPGAPGAVVARGAGQSNRAPPLSVSSSASFALIAASIRSPMALSMFFQYW